MAKVWTFLIFPPVRVQEEKVGKGATFATLSSRFVPAKGPRTTDPTNPAPCTCRKAVEWHHPDGTVTCVRCRGRIEEKPMDGRLTTRRRSG